MTVQPMHMYSKFVSMLPKTNSEVFVVCAQIEQEIAELDEDEKKLFLDDLGLEAVRSGKTDQSKLPSARTDQLSDIGRAGVHEHGRSKGNKGTSGSRQDSYGF